MMKNINLMVPDSGEGTKFEPVDGVELKTPLYLNNLLYEISGYFTSAVQDLADCSVQVKSVNADIENGEIWNKQVIKEAVTATGLGDFKKYMNDCSTYVENNTDFMTFIDDINTDLFTTLEGFTEYAWGVEYLIALIETELQNSLTPEEYEEFINGIKDDRTLNSLKSFSDDYKVSKYIGMALKKARNAAFSGMAPAGLALLGQMYEIGLDKAFKNFNYKKFFDDTLKNFMQGHTGKVPTPKSALISGTASALVFFVIGIGMDAIKGEFSLENVAIKGAQAGVSVVSGVAGSAVVSALQGSAAGSWAGPIGMAVGAVVSIVGNLIIDSVVHSIHYAANDLPRDYTEVELSDIQQQMRDQGYLTSAPKAGIYEQESVYDTCASLVYAGADPKIIEFLQQKVYGENLELMSAAEYEHYLTMFNRFRYTFYAYGYDLNNKEQTIADLIKDYHHLVYDVWDTDDAILTNLLELYYSDDPKTHEIMERILKGELFANFDEFDSIYNPEYN